MELKTFRLHGLPFFSIKSSNWSRPLLVQQEILVHDEKFLDVQVGLQRTHDLEELFTGLIEIQVLALTAKHG